MATDTCIRAMRGSFRALCGKTEFRDDVRFVLAPSRATCPACRDQLARLVRAQPEWRRRQRAGRRKHAAMTMASWRTGRA